MSVNCLLEWMSSFKSTQLGSRAFLVSSPLLALCGGEMARRQSLFQRPQHLSQKQVEMGRSTPRCTLDLVTLSQGAPHLSSRSLSPANRCKFVLPRQDRCEPTGSRAVKRQLPDEGSESCSAAEPMAKTVPQFFICQMGRIITKAIS